MSHWFDRLAVGAAEGPRMTRRASLERAAVMVLAAGPLAALAARAPAAGDPCARCHASVRKSFVQRQAACLSGVNRHGPRRHAPCTVLTEGACLFALVASSVSEKVGCQGGAPCQGPTRTAIRPGRPPRRNCIRRAPTCARHACRSAASAATAATPQRPVRASRPTATARTSARDPHPARRRRTRRRSEPKSLALRQSDFPASARLTFEQARPSAPLPGGGHGPADAATFRIPRGQKREDVHILVVTPGSAAKARGVFARAVADAKDFVDIVQHSDPRLPTYGDAEYVAVTGDPGAEETGGRTGCAKAASCGASR